MPGFGRRSPPSRGWPAGAPVVRLVNSILAQAAREGASDIHISPEAKTVQLRFRIDGKLHEVPSPPRSMILPIVSRLKISFPTWTPR